MNLFLKIAVVQILANERRLRHNAYAAAYRKRHPARALESQQRYGEKFPNRVKAAQLKYYRNNIKQRRLDSKLRMAKWRAEFPLEYEAYKNSRKKENLESSRKWRRKNRARCIQKTREWRQKNKARVTATARARNKRRMATDMAFRVKNSLRKMIWKQIKRKKDTKRTATFIGCTIAELVKHLESQFKDGMSWGNYGPRGWHIDHILPCASFDMKDQEQVRKCFHFSNLQPLFWLDNLKKGSKILTPQTA